MKQALFDIEFQQHNIIEELGKTGLKLTPEQISQMQQHMGNSDLHKRLKEIVTAPDWKKAVQDYQDKLQGRYTVSHATHYRSIARSRTSFQQDDALNELKQEYPELQESTITIARTTLKTARMVSTESHQQ